MSQLIVIVQVLATEGQCEYPLPGQCAHRMFNQSESAQIDETLRQPLDQTDGRIGLAEQQGCLHPN